jgi:ATPases of the AAA+ class
MAKVFESSFVARERKTSIPTKKNDAQTILELLTSKLSNSGDSYVEQTEVVYDGSAIKLPVGMPVRAAIENLERLDAYEQQTIRIAESIDCFPQDGAVALQRVLKRKYGWATALPEPGFFGPEPPMVLTVEVGVNETLQVPWGRFALPNVNGWIQTGASKVRGRMVFQLQAMVLRRHESEVKAIAEAVRQEVAHNSIYRGKAVKLAFTDEHSMWSGDTRVAEISFMDVGGIKREDLVYSRDVEDSILTNLIAPLENRSKLAKYGIPFKRGILLAGIYGTGKTMATNLAAKVAADNGITFVHITDASDFAEGLVFARQYQPAILSCEDIDRVTSGERDHALDTILNTIDGIDSKATDVMVVVTTNNVHAVHQGMLRPGRLDAVIEVKPPDAEAVMRLIRLYGRGQVAPDADLTRVGRLLNGQIPAVVREVIERAKLAAIRLGSEDAQGNLVITDAALVDSANTMRMQIELLNRTPEASPSDLERFGAAFGKSAGRGLQAMAETMSGQVTATRIIVHNEDSGRLEYMSPLPSGALEALAAESTNSHD